MGSVGVPTMRSCPHAPTLARGVVRVAYLLTTVATPTRYEFGKLPSNTSPPSTRYPHHTPTRAPTREGSPPERRRAGTSRYLANEHGRQPL